MKSYILCSTPRTGSTLLCDLLKATKTCGAPDSFFMADADPHWLTVWGMPVGGDPADRGYCTAMLKGAVTAGKGGTNVFGLRLMWSDLSALSALIGTVHPGLDRDSDRLTAAFGDVVYIHLRRGDKLAQAVSMVKAEQTGLWHIAPDGTEVERLAPPAQAEYDYTRIAAKMAELQAYDTAWTDWFEAEGITPITIGYESLSNDPGSAVNRICAALGVPAPAQGSLRPGVAKLADAVSLDWMRRFREESIG